MRILVTGITGRIGANLAAALVDRGHHVRGLVWARDQRTEKLQGLGVELQHGSLTEERDVQRAVEGMDAVYHLGGAFQGGGPFSTEEYFEINVRGTFLMLEAARAQAQLQQFLFASTDALYEKYVPGGMAEPIDQDTTPRRPKGWYALSKSMGEELCNGYYRTYNTPVTILRFALVVGAGEIVDFPQFYLSNLSRTHPDLAPLYKGDERLVILKDDQGRPFKKHIAEVRDIVGGCLAALGKGDALGQTFQLAGPEAFTWDRVIPYLSERLNIPSIEAETIAIPTHYEYDISKAKRLLDFQPQYDIFRMIDDALAFKRGENVGILPTQ